jgi:hypothetical protein
VRTFDAAALVGQLKLTVAAGLALSEGVTYDQQQQQ